MRLDSERLIYEKIVQNHAHELKDVLCDPRVYVRVDDGIAPSFEELLESFIMREKGSSGHRNNETWIDYVVRLKESQTAIGRVEATVIENRAEVAYLLGVSYWRKGYGSESLMWMQKLLQTNYGVKEFWATVTPGNEASRYLLLKNDYIQVSHENLPQLTSYEENDWVFYRLAKSSAHNCLLNH